MNKIKISFIIFAIILNYLQFNIVIAEEIPPSSVINDSIIINNLPSNIDTIIDQAINLQTSGDIPPIQDTINTQNGSSTTILNDELIIPDIISTTTILNDELIIPDIISTTTSSIIDNNQVVSEAISPIDLIIEPIEKEIPIKILYKKSLRRVELKPKSIYTFSIANSNIKTEKIEKNTTKDNFQKSKSINNTANPIIENNGDITVSGSCNNKYFVVLLYKNKNDYVDNSGNSIFNSAFDCLNNSYNYSIKDLPRTLTDGTYYLLVGQQGDIGTWIPISTLSEIVINKNVSTYQNEEFDEEIIIQDEVSTSSNFILSTSSMIDQNQTTTTEF
jgi:hypothetical protein